MRVNGLIAKPRMVAAGSWRPSRSRKVARVESVLRQQLTEAIAGDVFQRADKAGEVITMELVGQ